MVSGARRVPFVPGDVEGVIAFCAAHDSPYDAGLLRRLLLTLTSDPAGVFVIADEGGTALVATVIDRVHNGIDAANLEVLALRPPAAPALLADVVLGPAVAFARAGARRALQVGPPPALAGAARALLAAGFAHAYDMVVMRRPRRAPPPALANPPAGWRWGDLDEALADEAHQAITEMFAGSPSLSLPPAPLFRRAVAARATRWRVLCDGARLAGLVQVATDGRIAELRTVGRLPAYRGRGVGPLLVAEGLRLLLAEGSCEIELSAEAANDAALALYRRFHFEVASRTPWYLLPLGR